MKILNKEKFRSSDPLGRYYTSSSIASLLVKNMNGDPSTVIDLGSGDGALVREGAKIWDKAKFLTVDIDANATSAKLPQLAGPSFTHLIADALDKNIQKKLDINFRSADFALCNPPYIRPRWKKHFSEILEDGGLSHVFPSGEFVPSDLLFIAQNLRFLKKGGGLGLILPDGIVSGEKFSKLRRELILSHRLEKIIELPRRIFKNTDAKAHIVVLSKSMPISDSVSIQRLELQGHLSESIDLPLDLAINRLDFSFYFQDSKFSKAGFRLGDYVNFIGRGQFSSSERKEISIPIFHTSDFSSQSEYIPPRFCISKVVASGYSRTIAGPGDILIARVGRNLEQKVGMVRRGFVVVTDCILIIRCRPDVRDRIFKYLRSKAGERHLSNLAHGVAAKFITPTSILESTIHF